ncbi:MAG TPA: NAD(P)-dependent oxidoreductase [Gemmatimonadaceae bacterium]|nr:NAD(P)-dependent oxidoreductase [Gemmatimonadaceae bacterium]
MTRVLVTGATGFLGRQVVPALVRAGVEVHAVTSGVSREDEDHDARWHRADLLDRERMVSVVNSVKGDTLLHLAWFAKPPHYWHDLDNIRWTAASLELARAFVAAGGTRIVAAGTCAEYDWRSGYCVEASTPIAPASLYGASKAAFGGLLQVFAAEAGIEAAWARLFFLFGPNDAPSRLVPSLITRLHAGEVAVCTSGSLLRDYLYVTDAAEAMVALSATHVTGAVNVASGVPVAISTIASAIARHMRRPDLLRLDDGSSDYPLVAARVERLTREVGWRPRFDLETGLDETIRWWTSPGARTAVA